MNKEERKRIMEREKVIAIFEQATGSRLSIDQSEALTYEVNNVSLIIQCVHYTLEYFAYRNEDWLSLYNTRAIMIGYGKFKDYKISERVRSVVSTVGKMKRIIKNHEWD